MKEENSEFNGTYSGEFCPNYHGNVSVVDHSHSQAKDLEDWACQSTDFRINC